MPDFKDKKLPDNGESLGINTSFDDSDMSPEEREEFLNGTPTRAEVANFVGGYLSNDVLPQLIGYINQQDNRNLALISVCQAVLVSQGIISKENMDTLISDWNKKNKKDMNKKSTNIPGVIK